MVKNNIINIVESVLKCLILRAECLKLDVCISWEGDKILKTYTNITKLIDTNRQKLDCYNDLQSQMESVNMNINRDLSYITCTSFKIKNNIFNQIQKHDNVVKVIEDKYKHMCELNYKISVTEELLADRLGFYKCIFNNMLYLVVP